MRVSLPPPSLSLPFWECPRGQFGDGSLPPPSLSLPFWECPRGQFGDGSLPPPSLSLPFWECPRGQFGDGYECRFAVRSSLHQEMATHSGILVWKIPWTQEPGGLQPMGSQRVRHDLVLSTRASLHLVLLI